MPNINNCRSYILHNYPHLMGAFESLAEKIELMGTKYKGAIKQIPNLTIEEMEVFKILYRADD